MYFCSTGKLKYVDNPYKLIVEVDKDLSEYYRSLIPKYLRINRQKFDPHISIIRDEIIINNDYWNIHQNETIDFVYENVIYNDLHYYWLGVESIQLESIRLELGLESNSEITRSPDSGHTFHITLGNLKNYPAT